jgi:catechol-2,3-dioxygenase
VSGATHRRFVSGLVELTLETRDLAECERFYADVLGLELVSRDEDRVWLAVGEHVRLGLWTPGTKEFGDRGGRHVHFAFSASARRLDALAEHLTEAGVEVRGPVEHPGGDRSIYFQDPAGNMLEAWDFLHRADPDGGGVKELGG